MRRFAATSVAIRFLFTRASLSTVRLLGASQKLPEMCALDAAVKRQADNVVCFVHFIVTFNRAETYDHTLWECSMVPLAADIMRDFFLEHWDSVLISSDPDEGS